MDVIKLLGKYINDGNGKPKRGSIARVAEHLGCSYSAVRNWFFGDRYGNYFHPSKAMAAKIEDLVRQKKDVSGKIPGWRRGKKRARKRNNSQLKEKRLQAV